MSDLQSNYRFFQSQTYQDLLRERNEIIRYSRSHSKYIVERSHIHSRGILAKEVRLASERSMPHKVFFNTANILTLVLAKFVSKKIYEKPQEEKCSDVYLTPLLGRILFFQRGVINILQKGGVLNFQRKSGKRNLLTSNLFQSLTFNCKGAPCS